MRHLTSILSSLQNSFKLIIMPYTIKNAVWWLDQNNQYCQRRNPTAFTTTPAFKNRLRHILNK